MLEYLGLIEIEEKKYEYKNLLGHKGWIQRFGIYFLVCSPEE
jgi:hypothetical protein